MGLKNKIVQHLNEQLEEKKSMNSDQLQLLESIRAFKEGKEQPEGRYKIIGRLDSEGKIIK